MKPIPLRIATESEESEEKPKAPEAYTAVESTVAVEVNRAIPTGVVVYTGATVIPMAGEDQDDRKRNSGCSRQPHHWSSYCR